MIVPSTHRKYVIHPALRTVIDVAFVVTLMWAIWPLPSPRFAVAIIALNGIYLSSRIGDLEKK
jgi:hypothetical protein